MPRVTPAGVRAGLAEALAGLVELRGSAVYAYAGAVSDRDGAQAAAGEAMAAFRANVVRSTDIRGLAPDAILLRAVRETSAARARRPAGSGSTLRLFARRGGSACDLVPRLLAARANRDLSHDDAVRLDRHMAGCSECRDLRERFRTAENLYAEASGTQPDERDARALLLALAGAAPLADGTPQSITEEALALLSADPEVTQEPATSSATAEAPSSVDVPTPRRRPPDPWPSNPPAAGARPARTPAPGEAPTAREHEGAPLRNGSGATDGAPAARYGVRFGTAPGRVSFGRRTVVIRSGIERSGPASPPPDPEPEQRAAEPEQPAPEPPAPPTAPEPHGPARHGDRPEPAASAPSFVARVQVLPAAAPGGPGAPPDSGTLARVIPGVLIVMAIGIALLVAGIVGAGNTPATTDDIAPPGLREPARELDTTDTLRTPPVPGTEAAPNAN